MQGRHVLPDVRFDGGHARITVRLDRLRNRSQERWLCQGCDKLAEGPFVWCGNFGGYGRSVPDWLEQISLFRCNMFLYYGEALFPEVTPCAPSRSDSMTTTTRC